MKKSTFLKSLFEAGMIVITRCGINGVVVRGDIIAFSSGIAISAEEYDEHLQRPNVSDMDIMKVYDTNMELIWEREEVKSIVLGIEIEYKDDDELHEKINKLLSLGEVSGDFSVDKSFDKKIWMVD